MIVVEPSFEFQDKLDAAGIAVRLEACGRICYKSEDKITEDSAVPFVKRLASYGHNSVLEMAVVTVQVDCTEQEAGRFFALQPKFLVVDQYQGGLLLTGSVRSFRELGKRCPDAGAVRAAIALLAERHPWLYEGIYEAGAAVDPAIRVRKVRLDEVESLPDELLMRHRYMGVKFIVNRAVSHELVRHRTCSFLQESQRYCNYNREKFGGQVSFVRPVFFREGSEEYRIWLAAMQEAEARYLKLLETSSPQAARTVLPNSCKTEIIVYCSLEEWRHIIRLRTPKNADPSMREIMLGAAEEFAGRYAVMGG
ncbi:MAG: FAD-dependent thymidylate synthase [Deltaproteobacteria bacterium]|nr:MAG: FAD-dependent thymidylate synthase [Deltaproteobacteria bacterium]